MTSRPLDFAWNFVLQSTGSISLSKKNTGSIFVSRVPLLQEKKTTKIQAHVPGSSGTLDHTGPTLQEFFTVLLILLVRRYRVVFLCHRNIHIHSQINITKHSTGENLVSSNTQRKLMRSWRIVWFITQCNLCSPKRWIKLLDRLNCLNHLNRAELNTIKWVKWLFNSEFSQ